MSLGRFRLIQEYVSNLFSLKRAQLRPIQCNKVVFRSYRGTKYNDNPMYISELLYSESQKRGIDIDIVWITNGQITIPRYARSVLQGSKDALTELATAKVWVDNVRKDLWDRKRVGQYYIQTWHGGTSVKKVEGDAKDKLHKSYIRRAHLDSKLADVFISCSKWNTEMFRRAFWFNGEVLEYGSPRSDVFYQDTAPYERKVRDYFDLDEDEHIVLYAPTFRNDENMDCYQIDCNGLLKQLNDCWGGKWKLIIRLHPNLAKRQNALLYSNDVLNGSAYPDMNELIIASDLLISDYSSCMFDAMEAHKRVFIYASDVEHYLSERGIYFSLEEMPFPVANTNQQLMSLVSEYDYIKYEKEASDFKQQLGLVNDGHASMRCVDLILRQMGYENT